MDDSTSDAALQPAMDSLVEAASQQSVVAVAASRSHAKSQLPTISTLSRYHNAHPETRSLNSLYSMYRRRCGPSHGADVDMSNLPERRSRRQSSPSCLATLPEPDYSIPPAVTPGYAECTRKAFDNVCLWLCESAPLGLRMGADSVFLDIGSGYGKCVIHARIRAGVRRSIGIEFVAVRYEMGMEMLMECIPAQFERIHEGLGGCVELLEGDATDEHEFASQYDEATHIFMFDWVFNPAGRAGVVQLIHDRASQLRVLVSCQRPEHMPQFQELGQMQLSTGIQHPMVYFYKRRSNPSFAAADIE
jgi:hypothetical protein